MQASLTSRLSVVFALSGSAALLFENEIFSRHFTVDAIVRFQQHGTAAAVPTHFFHANRHWLISSFPMVVKSGRALQGIAAIDISTRINAEDQLL